MTSLNFRDPENRLHTTYAQPPTVAKPAMLCEDCQQAFMLPYPHKVAEDRWHIPASKGPGCYEVKLHIKGLPDSWKCECPGATFRPTALCRHAEKVYYLESLLVSGRLGALHIKYLPTK